MKPDIPNLQLGDGILCWSPSLIAAHSGEDPPLRIRPGGVAVDNSRLG